MPKQIHEIKDFLLTARRKDARSVKIWNFFLMKLRRNDGRSVKIKDFLLTKSRISFSQQSLPPGLRV
uniref:60S ribosomal protein L38-like n=1 Tax=Nicotiana sylvestris TaxID=4096 RepID=A0A1U7YAQ0_NICSY|nr:PREDICTED: 60S ribosomal protein L38-like [Nicotiana sylvestris]